MPIAVGRSRGSDAPGSAAGSAQARSIPELGRTDAQAQRRGDGYSVGYGKPPMHSQFRPGQSGNPAGRRKGVRNLKTDVKRTLKAPVKVKEGERSRKNSTQEGALIAARKGAQRRCARARSADRTREPLQQRDGRDRPPRRWPPTTKPCWPPTRPKARPPQRSRPTDPSRIRRSRRRHSARTRRLPNE